MRRGGALNVGKSRGPEVSHTAPTRLPSSWVIPPIARIEDPVAVEIDRGSEADIRAVVDVVVERWDAGIGVLGPDRTRPLLVPGAEPAEVDGVGEPDQPGAAAPLEGRDAHCLTEGRRVLVMQHRTCRTREGCIAAGEHVDLPDTAELAGARGGLGDQDRGSLVVRRVHHAEDSPNVMLSAEPKATCPTEAIGTPRKSLPSQS